MSVIIRLQNLPWNASALDIRRFFHGLSIPDGGVHIIGGEKGDAFIAFSTDEDARQGMLLTGECVNDLPVRLFLSSKSEMQNVIASARTGPVNVTKNKDDIIDRPLPQKGDLGRNDEFRGPSFPVGRGTGFPDMPNSRNPGSVLPSPPSRMFGGSSSQGNPNLHSELNFNQSGGLNSQRGPNPNAFNKMEQNQINFNRSGLNPMCQPNQPDSNHRGEGNLQGFNRSGGRLLEEVKPGRLLAPPSQIPQIRTSFDPSSFDSGNRNGNIRGMDRPQGEVLDMPPNRKSQFIGLHDNGQFSSEQSIGGSWGQSIEKRDIERIGGALGGNNMLGMDRDFIGQDFNRSDNNMRDANRNFDMSNRFSHGENFGLNERFNNGMDVDVDRSRFNDRIDLNNRDFGARFNNRMDTVGPNRGDSGVRGEDAGLNTGCRDLFRDRESFGLDGNRLGMTDPDEFGRKDVGFGRGNPVLPVQRRGVGLSSDFNQVGGFVDPDDFREHSNDFASRGPGRFQSGRSFGSQEPVRPFGVKEPARPFEEQDPSRSCGGSAFGRPFGGLVSVRSFVGQEGERNAPWSAEPMDDFKDGYSGRNEERTIPSLMSPRDYQLHRVTVGLGGAGSLDSRNNDWCVHISNLPVAFHYRDIRKLFASCDIPREGIKLINDKFGVRSGAAFVKFDFERSFSIALAMNNQIVDGKKLKIDACLVKEYDNAVDSYVPCGGGGGGVGRNNVRRSRSPLNRRTLPDKTQDLCVIIKRMPLKTTSVDVKNFLGNGLQITATGGPYLDLDKDNQPTGNAVVEFAREKDYKDALLFNRRVMGRTSVLVIGISKIEFNEKSQAARRVAETKNVNSVKEPEREKRDLVEESKDSTAKQADTKAKESVTKRSVANEEVCVQLGGLSWNVTNQDIVEFFKGMKIAKDGIHFILSRDGKLSGTAYVEFTNEADKKRALMKHKHYIGKRYIEVTTIMYKQMMDKIKAAKVRCGGGGGVDDVIVLSEDESAGKSKAEHTVRMQNLHGDTQLEDIMDFFRGLHPIVDSIKLQYKDGKPTGDGLISFHTAHDASKALNFNRRSMLGRTVTLTVWPKK